MVEPPAPLRGIHHVKVAVSDLGRALGFYQAALQGRRIPEADHVRADGSTYAHVLDVPGLGCYVEIRLDAEQAARHAGFDALTIAVDDRAALESWTAVLDAGGIPHSSVLTAIQAWLVVVEDPDGNRFRLYTLEQHGPEVPPSRSPWLES